MRQALIKGVVWVASLGMFPWCALGQGDEQLLQAGAMNVLIVFDASQSMYGKLGSSSQSKLDLAKGLLETTLETWPEDVQLGLLAYGHRGRRAPGGDRCRDIELLVPVAPGTAGNVRRQVRALLAKGTTPLCRALVQAREHLGTTSPGNLVLLSDGSEECGGDLLETVRMLASEESELTVDVLSLGQTEEQNAPLEELTRLTDGRLFAVRNDADAKTGIEVIMQRLFSRSNLSVTAHDLWDNDGITETPLSWELYGVEGQPSLVGSFSGPALRLNVTPGLYWVVAQGPKNRYGFQVHVPQKKTVAKRLSLELGQIELIPQGMTNADRWSYRIRSVMPGRDSSAAIVSEVNVTGKQEVSLPHGHYRVTFQRDGTATPSTQEVIVESERRHLYDLSFKR